MARDSRHFRGSYDMIRALILLSAAAPICLLASTSAQAPKKPTPGAKIQATQKHEQAVPFKVGEKLTYDIGWSSYMTAGTATITVHEKKPSYRSTAYYVAAEGRPTPLLSRLYTLYYKVDTLLDVFSLLPQRGSIYSEEGKRRRMKSTIFNQAARTARYEVKTATLVQTDLKIPASAHDALSALYVLRARPLKPGQTFQMPVVDNGTVYSVEMTVGGVEQVTTGMGTFPALKVTPTIRPAAGQTAPARGLSLWFTNDGRRLPVKIQADLAVGSFTLVLAQASGL